MRAVLLAALVLGACVGTSPNEIAPVDAAPDASTCEAATTPGLPGPPGDPNAGANHHVGEDCAACHLTGVEGAPLFSVAGTLYDGPSGTKPVAGATIIVHDAAGVEIKMATALNGNFYSTQTVTLPFQGGEMFGSKASQCPKTRTMQQTALGSCNTTNCHAADSTQGRVYLQLVAPGG